MRKDRELIDPKSCLNRAHGDELLFVLLGRDPAAPHAIREWAKRRIELGKNAIGDAQIQEALQTAHEIEAGQAPSGN